jgi:hypothetical protein
MDPRNFAIAALAQIPGMSATAANAVLAHYEYSLQQLVHDFDASIAKDFKLNDKRRIGPKLAQRIAEYIVGNRVEKK